MSLFNYTPMLTHVPNSIVRKERSTKKSSSAKKSRVLSTRVMFPRARKGLEPKYVDVDQALGVNTTPLFVLANGTKQGYEYYQRVGNSILMHWLHVKMYIEPFYYAANTFWDFLKFAVVFDRQPNGAFPGYSDIWQNTTVGGSLPTAGTITHPNPVNNERFKVIRNWYKYVPQTNGNAAVGVEWTFDPNTGKMYGEMFIPLKGLETRYNSGTSGTVSDINSGSLLLVVTSDKVTSGNSGVNLQVSARLKYTD